MAKNSIKSIDELATKIESGSFPTTIPTGIYSLDSLLNGGIDLGSKVQIVAESSTGKSTIALQICKNWCIRGRNVFYIDSENSITKELLESTGCDFYTEKQHGYGRLVILKKSSFNDVSEYLDKAISLREFSLVVIDSLASLVNDCYVDIENEKKDKVVKSLTNNNTNYESRPINLFINKYSALASRYKIAFLFVNQYRNKVDPLKGTVLKEYGNKIVRYNSDIIIKIKKEKEMLWETENEIYSDKPFLEAMPATHARLTFTVDKSNKVITGTAIESYIKYGYGLDANIESVLKKIRDGDIIKSGKYYTDENGNTYDGFINLLNSTVERKATDEEDESVFIDPDEDVSVFIDPDDEEYQ
ncbi:MAG: AAA family ATPase [Clostridiales bacterium]|nr:AAA family ATPase [Clostridiales bacterium]